MQTSIVCVALLLLAAFSHAQISENFQSVQVPWQGADAAWKVSNGRLQSSCMQPNSNFWIWAPARIRLPVTWEWWMQLDFNTSSNNYTDVYLISGSSNLLQNSAGYFIRIGDKDDEVCLYKKHAADSVEKLIDGRNGLTNKRFSVIRLKVTCDDMFNWRLWIDSTGTGLHYMQEGIVRNIPVTDSVCFGIMVQQSTASFFEKHFFDDVTVTPLVKDTVPPQLLSVNVLSDTKLLLSFSEPPDSAVAAVPGNYKIGTAALHPVHVISSAGSVRLVFGQPFPSGDSILLQLTGITDAAGNSMPPAHAWFVYYQPRRYEVALREILPDPDPPVSNPLPEFIELQNSSPYPVQLDQWRLSAGAGQVVLPPFWLEPDSLLILCRKDRISMFTGSVRVLGVDDFPVLGNDSDTLALYNNAGSVMHAVAYDKDWFAGSGKEKGGWSLEMATTAFPCGGRDAWKPSVAASGSTPGLPNSSTDAGTDNTAPELSGIILHDSLTASLYFSKTLDSAKAADPALYKLSPASPAIASLTAVPPLFNTVLLRLATPLPGTAVCTLQVDGVTDCSGTRMDARNSAVFALPAAAGSGDILFSELLFDAQSPAPEFVEIYNHGARAVNLQELFITAPDRDTARIPLSRTQRLLLPRQYMALTRDPGALCRYYTCKAWENLAQLSALPALPNEGGALALYNAAGVLLDLVHYSPDMQSPLVGNAKGVSLERLSFQQPAQDKGNWHPAAVTAGYATPGSANSQQLNLQELPGEVTVQPSVFSPDNDGMDDVAVIACRLPQAGFVGNITIFDAVGRPVRRLLQSGQLGIQGNVIWDGLGENKERLAAGIYIIFTEVFDLQGRVKRWKLPVVVARKLNLN
jgi:hypothetical protein